MKYFILITILSSISMAAIPEVTDFECDDGSTKTLDKSSPSAVDENGYPVKVEMLNGGKAASFTFENGNMLVCTQKKPGLLFY